MEQPDHSYTNGMCDQINTAEFTYKMSKNEIEDFVKLRISNNSLFSGRKNSSKSAWRAILEHMGLHYKMTHRQASKKWDNLKKKYKELKNPPEGVKVVPETWSCFTLMDDAMNGRLDGMAPVVKASHHPSTSSDFLPTSMPKRRRISNLEVSFGADLVASEPEIEVSLKGDVDEEEMNEIEGSEEIDHFIQEVEVGKDSKQQMTKREMLLIQRDKAVIDREIAALDREQAFLGRERAMLERERAMMEREATERGKAVMQRERAVMERERAVMERERAVMERERAVMEREKWLMEKDRDALCRERQALIIEKARWEKHSAQNESTEETTDDGSKVIYTPSENTENAGGGRGNRWSPCISTSPRSVSPMANVVIM